MSYYTRRCPDGMTLAEFAAEEADPEPHPGEPPCGHKECSTAWEEDNCMEDRLDDWGDGSCIEVYKWEVHVDADTKGMLYDWFDHPDHPDGFEGTFSEAKEFFKSVKGDSDSERRQYVVRLWPVDDPLQRESNEDLFLFKTGWEE